MKLIILMFAVAFVGYFLLEVLVGITKEPQKFYRKDLYD